MSVCCKMAALSHREVVRTQGANTGSLSASANQRSDKRSFLSSFFVSPQQQQSEYAVRREVPNELAPSHERQRKIERDQSHDDHEADVAPRDQHQSHDQ